VIAVVDYFVFDDVVAVAVVVAAAAAAVVAAVAVVVVVAVAVVVLVPVELAAVEQEEYHFLEILFSLIVEAAGVMLHTKI
jgi:hypothetical protein